MSATLAPFMIGHLVQVAVMCALTVAARRVGPGQQLRRLLIVGWAVVIFSSGVVIGWSLWTW